jgi:hypothetical protein
MIQSLTNCIKCAAIRVVEIKILILNNLGLVVGDSRDEDVKTLAAQLQQEIQNIASPELQAKFSTYSITMEETKWQARY